MYAGLKELAEFERRLKEVRESLQHIEDEEERERMIETAIQLANIGGFGNE